jgi:hypothetical protein
VNFRAESTFKPVDLVRLQARIVPKIVAAVTEGCGAVVDEAQAIAPVGETGDFRDSIHTASVEVVGTAVNGRVVNDSDHAGFVEFGTGLRGEGTYPYDLPESGVPITGSWIYDYKKQNWQGHAAQPTLRPALDAARGAIRGAFLKQGFRV